MAHGKPRHKPRVSDGKQYPVTTSNPLDGLVPTLRATVLDLADGDVSRVVVKSPTRAEVLPPGRQPSA